MVCCYNAVCNMSESEELTFYDWACLVTLTKQYIATSQSILDVHFPPESTSITMKAKREMGMARCKHFAMRLLRAVLMVHGIQTDEHTAEGRANVWALADDRDRFLEPDAASRADDVLKDILMPTAGVTNCATPDHRRMAEFMASVINLLQETGTKMLFSVNNATLDDAHFYKRSDQILSDTVSQIGLDDDRGARESVVSKINSDVGNFATAVVEHWARFAKDIMKVDSDARRKLTDRVVECMKRHRPAKANNVESPNSDSDSDSDIDEEDVEILKKLAALMALRLATQ